ncbi:hypothetical protein GHC57_18190 [Roseospira navarrensis]|uniref:Uncharacterized protein n=1 Tax=Roseospira navarrensis TaxID=140058 RepID=A0A7X2D528_9PROT|nr:hypothetical protein [Roseospira navarrensis]
MGLKKARGVEKKPQGLMRQVGSARK